MIRPLDRRRAVRLRPWALVVASVAGCAEVAEPQGEEDVESYRLGRVHVVIDSVDASQEDDASSEPLAVTARFAFVRGLPESFARARIDMPHLAADVLELNECARQSFLVANDDELDEAPEVNPARELVLADVGALELEVGGTRTALPLSLVPDLLPYMSGVEYVYVGAGTAMESARELAIRSRGSEADRLPAFEVESRLPDHVRLELETSDRPDILSLRWQESGDVPLTLRIVAQSGSATVGEPLVCLLDDIGQARLSIPHLISGDFPTGVDTLRLDDAFLQANRPPRAVPREIDTLRLEISRFEVSHFTVGTFESSELLVERKTTLELDLSE